ncbi:hypothetical protein [Plantactinospora soyae]|uniref:Uncharacterized protein n=1 Tax=Plantactinospora soyae TaxID=1544732 RepID=A0A927R131_9ACTN|nr:hypothetical protein [Plantactinospora soyae]MBE1489283.1 hypothetical protein [Plantactinospora soyae]
MARLPSGAVRVLPTGPFPALTRTPPQAPTDRTGTSVPLQPLTRRTQGSVGGVPPVVQPGPQPTGGGFRTTPRRVLRREDRTALETFLAQHPEGSASITVALRAALEDVLARDADAELSERELAAVQAVLARRDVQRLTGGVRTGANLGQQPVTAPGPVPTEKPVDPFAEQVAAIAQEVSDNAGPFTAFILRHLARIGSTELSTPRLIEVVEEVGTRLYALAMGEDLTDDSPYARLAREIAGAVEQPGQLQQTLGMHAPPAIPRAQIERLNRFLSDHPQLVAAFRRNGLSFKFNADLARKIGGLYTHGDKTIHMEELPGLAPEVFLRLFLHEAGHATFQRALLRGQELPAILDKADGLNLLIRLENVGRTMADPSGPAQSLLGRPQLEHLQEELTTIQETLEDQAPVAAFEQLSADAQRMYRAWLVLRESGGAGLLAIALVGFASEGERRIYQADTFIEFLAEVFMQTAMGDIAVHLRRVLDEEGDSPIGQAWAAVRDILVKYAVPILRAPTRS